MKKIFVALMALVALCACSGGEKKGLAYRGLSMDLPFRTFIDSLQARGFAIDSAKTDSDFQMVVMGNDAVRYRLVVAQKDGGVAALQEAGYTDLGKIAKATDYDIRNIEGIGEKQIEAIRHIITEFANSLSSRVSIVLDANDPELITEQ